VVLSASQQGVSIGDTAFQILEGRLSHNRLLWLRHAFVMVTWPHPEKEPDQLGDLRPPPGAAIGLGAAGEGRQYFNLYGVSQLPLKIFRVSRVPIDQYRTHLDDSVEVWIRPLLARNLEGLSDRLGLDHLLGDACCSPCASPVVKGNGHHCVTLKHAFRPYRGGLKASTGIEP
jgi:hypothetical protein